MDSEDVMIDHICNEKGTFHKCSQCETELWVEPSISDLISLVKKLTKKVEALHEDVKKLRRDTTITRTGS